VINKIGEPECQFDDTKVYGSWYDCVMVTYKNGLTYTQSACLPFVPFPGLGIQVSDKLTMYVNTIVWAPAEKYFLLEMKN